LKKRKSDKTGALISQERIESTTILSGIEADWVAGRFRAHVEPNTLMTPEGEAREHAFVTDAKRRLRALIDSLQSTITGV